MLECEAENEAGNIVGYTWLRVKSEYPPLPLFLALPILPVIHSLWLNQLFFFPSFLREKERRKTKKELLPELKSIAGSANDLLSFNFACKRKRRIKWLFWIYSRLPVNFDQLF